LRNFNQHFLKTIELFEKRGGVGISFNSRVDSSPDFEREILLHITRKNLFGLFERAKSRASVRQMQIPGIYDNKLTKN
jgi:hypothetical protein